MPDGNNMNGRDTALRFTKMQGIGNDYIYVNCFEETVRDPGKVSVFVSDRHFGIGSDGLILIKPSEEADFCMEIYNADGSRAKMCGNGIRCVGKYVYDHGMTDKKEITVMSDAGIRTLQLNVADGKVRSVRVDMGAPAFEAESIPVTADTPEVVNADWEAAGRCWKATCVSMGNPHLVVLCEDPRKLDLEKIGPVMEKDLRFPEGVNTEFVSIESDNEVRMRVWERGSGETLACGTGACAVTAAMVRSGLTDRRITVHLTGGDLEIEWNHENNCIYMTGPAVTVFEGEIEIP